MESKGKKALAALNLPLDQKLPALFVFNIAIDVCQYAAAGLLLLFVNVFGKMIRWKKAVAYAAGILSVALLCSFWVSTMKVTAAFPSNPWELLKNASLIRSETPIQFSSNDCD
jgi:energy-converting hydrogenase Eha subunit A